MLFEIENYQSMKKALDSLCRFLSSKEVHPDIVFDSKLAACELLGNVLRHSDGGATLCSEVNAGFIELKILSKNPFIPTEITLPSVLSEHGRGLYLTQSVSTDGIKTIEGGILVKIKIEK